MAGPVASFRLDRRTEVTIKWNLLSCDTIICVIGKIEHFIAYQYAFTIVQNIFYIFRRNVSTLEVQPGRNAGKVHQF